MTRLSIPGITLLAFLILAGPARPEVIQLGIPQAPYHPGKVDTTITIEVKPLAAGVYAAKVSYVWTGWVETPDGIIVIDTGFSEACGRALADTIRARSGGKKIRTVVNTHGH